MVVEWNMLPGPVGAVLGPLLVTPRGSDLVRRMVLLVAEQIWIIVRAIFLNCCHSTRASGSLPSSACCGWGGGGALVSPTFCLLFPVDELQENRKVNARAAEEEERGEQLTKEKQPYFARFLAGCRAHSHHG